MRFRRAAYIFNPVSGRGAGATGIGQIRDILLASAREVHLAPTGGPHHASTLARDAVDAGSDLVVVQGGDGTVNEAVQGLAGTDSAALLVLPGGTANVLVKEVGLPRNAVDAARTLPALAARTVRLGLVEPAEGRSRYFLLMCGAGLDAEIAARTRTPLKRWLGEGAFWLHGAEQVFRRFPRLAIQEGPHCRGSGPSSLVVVSKSRRYGGGLILTPRANLLAARFEVVHLAGTSRLRYCGYLLAGVCSLTSRWPGIGHQTCRTVRLAADTDESVQLQVDGEVAGTLPAKVSLTSVSLALLLPAQYGRGGAQASVGSRLGEGHGIM